jgi:hypothetical protein
MSSVTTSLSVFACVFGAALFGMRLRRALPDHHLGTETKDTVKVAMGFVATMAALVLGLLVASAKDSYDKQASGVTTMAAKVIYIDRLLANFGPEAKDVRDALRNAVEQVTNQIWPSKSPDSQLDPSKTHAEQLIVAIQSLKAETEVQKTLQSQAVSTSLELGQLRWLEYEQANTGASKPMVCILVFWIAVLFGSFGMFAPINSTVITSFLLAALSVAGAIFLIMELRSPFSGLLQIPNTAFLDAIAHLGR